MLSRYFIVSAIALGVDWASYLALAKITGVAPGYAALVAYVAGGAVNYLLSRHLVFNSTTQGIKQAREALLFVLSCAFGSILTAGIVQMLARSSGLIAAKAIATVISFSILYGIRRYIVFRSTRPLPPPMA